MFWTSNALQGGNHLSKWFKRARVGIYLGMPPIHARSVALVLNVQTGLVSPQFHVKFDDMFETVQQPLEGQPMRWQIATHFSKQLSSQHTTKGAGNNSTKEQPIAPNDPPSIPPEPPPNESSPRLDIADDHTSEEPNKSQGDHTAASKGTPDTANIQGRNSMVF